MANTSGNYSDTPYPLSENNGYSGAGNASDASPAEFNMQQIWLQFRERIWLFLAVFLFVLGASIIYSFQKTPVYASYASVEILRDDPEVMGERFQKNLHMQQVASLEDLRTQISVLESMSILRKVADRLEGDELEAFMEPYKDVFRLKGPYTPEEVLINNRIIEPKRQSLMVKVGYRHPDPAIAAKIANLFAEEYRERNLRLIVDSSLGAVDMLQERIKEQRQQVRSLENQLTQYREKHDSVSFEERADIDHQELAQLNETFVERKNRLDTAETRWQLLKKYRSEGRNLWDLAFINDSRQLEDLLQQLSEVNVQIASLKKRYKEKHPRMQQVLKRREQIEQELANSAESAANRVESRYTATLDDFNAIKSRLKAKEQEIFKLDKHRIEYDSIQNDLQVARGIYQTMKENLELETAQANMKQPNVRIIDRAVPPAPNDYVTPNHFINIFLGFVGGSGIGFALVFGLAFIDPRIKTSSDVEQVLQLELLGLIPRIRHKNSFDKASAVHKNLNPSAAEAFRSLYSTIKVSPAGRYCQVVYLTSTIASEGKSFIATNLAQVYASHGEKTLLLDADLRVPSIAHSLKLADEYQKTGGGLSGYFSGKASWESLILQEVYENLDVMGSSVQAANPSEIINSSHFQDIITTLRNNYDRIIIDTPPLGVVSDALALVPIADGCLYIIRHKKVNKNTLNASVARMRKSQASIIGAVMNHIEKREGHSYNTYYHRAGKKYYEVYRRSGKNNKT